MMMLQIFLGNLNPMEKWRNQCTAWVCPRGFGMHPLRFGERGMGWHV
jgi:hypothetical protein